MTLLGPFTGPAAPHGTVLSPYFSSISHWNDRVFQVSKLRHQNFTAAYEKEVRDRILNVISKYRTGLKEDHLIQVSDRIIEESKKYGYDPLFLTALIITESSFYNWARSNRGALGLMQIRPRTGRAMAVEARVRWKGTLTLYKPDVNIALGAFYLNKLVRRFGDLALALEAYNHGPSQIARYLRKGYRPKAYSKKVFKNYHRIRSQQI
ncbi:MAG: lytic transglycosylase domain-containing protein [Nitrospinaceae bacterium]